MSTQSHLDLTEFVSKLIHDTFNAITVSSKEQAEAHFELTRMATLDFDAFRDRYITDAAIDDELLRLFPSEDEGHPFAIYEGAPFTAELKSAIESLHFHGSIKEAIALQQRRKKSLTAESVTLIRKGIQNILGRQHYDSFGEVLKRGIPRVIIDSGRVSAKMAFKTEEIEGSSATGSTALSAIATPNPAVSKMTALSSFDRTLFNKRIQEKISKTRVGIVLPDPHSSTGKTESTLWGEVEINFKTVD